MSRSSAQEGLVRRGPLLVPHAEGLWGGARSSGEILTGADRWGCVFGRRVRRGTGRWLFEVVFAGHAANRFTCNRLEDVERGEIFALSESLGVR